MANDSNGAYISLALRGQLPSVRSTSASLRQVLQHRTQLPGRRGLEEDRVARCACLSDVCGRGVSGYEGEADAGSTLAAQVLHHLDATRAVGKVEVAQDDVRTLLLRTGARFVAILNADHLALPLRQQAVHRF